MHASCGILFNHESSRRGEEFVTRKISKAVAEIACGLRDTFSLGNLDARRDWGYAPDYVEAMWRMLQQREPDDYVIATGDAHTVSDFVDAALLAAGVDRPRSEVVTLNAAFVRPAEVNVLRGEYRKANDRLGWSPITRFESLVKKMVAADIEALAGRVGSVVH